MTLTTTFAAKPTLTGEPVSLRPGEARCAPAGPQAANAASLRLLARLGFVERERFAECDADQVC